MHFFFKSLLNCKNNSVLMIVAIFLFSSTQLMAQQSEMDREEIEELEQRLKELEKQKLEAELAEASAVRNLLDANQTMDLKGRLVTKNERGVFEGQFSFSSGKFAGLIYNQSTKKKGQDTIETEPLDPMWLTTWENEKSCTVAVEQTPKGLQKHSQVDETRCWNTSQIFQLFFSETPLANLKSFSSEDKDNITIARYMFEEETSSIEFEFSQENFIHNNEMKNFPFLKKVTVRTDNVITAQYFYHTISMTDLNIAIPTTTDWRPSISNLLNVN